MASLEGDAAVTADDADRELEKLNRMCRQLFKKGALTVLDGRVHLRPARKDDGGPRLNHWFNLVLPDSDDCNREIERWATLDISEGRPPNMQIVFYLEFDLDSKQTVVISDADGAKWDVFDTYAMADISQPRQQNSRSKRIALERWCFSLGELSSPTTESPDQLAVVYKKLVVAFRTLKTQAMLLPFWKFLRQPSMSMTRDYDIKYEIFEGSSSTIIDDIELPLCPSRLPVADTWEMKAINTPAGLAKIAVHYRRNCTFQVVSKETALSSKITGYLPSDGTAQSFAPSSLPISGNYIQQVPDFAQAYGSMSTWHTEGPTSGLDPISTLGTQRNYGSPSDSMAGHSPPQKLPPNHRTVHGSKSSLRSNEMPPTHRRQSVSFDKVFKAGSVASSPPVPTPQVTPSPGSSVPRTSTLAHRSRNSTTTLPQAALRAPMVSNDTAIASSASSSPKPGSLPKYSSSFGNRKRFSSGAGSKTDEDNNSSGKASMNSSKPGSTTLAEAEAGGLLGDPQDEDEQLQSFISLLGQNPQLSSLNRTDPASRDAVIRRTNAELSKYRGMRDSNAALSESMSSSMFLQRSSSSSSRQLSNVPAMVAGTSLSTSSSPGKPISPHTPHTPAIPSRLSANSIAEYGDPIRSRSRPSGRFASRPEEDVREEGSSDTTAQGTTPIEIPTSPRPWPHNTYRSSSMSRQRRDVDEDLMRSSSYPGDGTEPALSLSELLRAGEPGPTLDSAGDAELASDLGVRPTEIGLGAGLAAPRLRPGMQRPSSAAAYDSGSDARVQYPFPRRPSSRGAYDRRRAARDDDDEPLLFTMNEVNPRRSIEEFRGGDVGGGTAGGRHRSAPWR